MKGTCPTCGEEVALIDLDLPSNVFEDEIDSGHEGPRYAIETHTFEDFDAICEGSGQIPERLLQVA